MSASPSEPTRVVAVVVTWNRRELLVEAIAALRAQTHQPVAFVVVDNGSTDGTDTLLEGESGLDVVRLEQNTGGAGGFAVGVEQALTHEPDLVWLLDDDTVPDTRCCARARPRLAGVRRRKGSPTGRAGEQGRVDRWSRPPDEHSATQAGSEPCRDRSRGEGRGDPHPFGVVRVDHVRRGRGPRAGVPVGRLLPLERRLRVLHPADPGPRRALLPAQCRGAQDEGVRLDRRRPRRAVLLRGTQQGVAVHPLPWPAADGEGRLRGVHAASLGTHVREVAGPHHPAACPGPRPACWPQRPTAELRRAPGGRLDLAEPHVGSELARR